MSDASSAGSAPVIFYPRRDMMLGLYGLAMIAVLAGIILVVVPTILAPGRAEWVLIPGVALLVAGLGLAGLGQLAMLGRRCILRFDPQRWTVRPIFGRSRSGVWTNVSTISRRDDAPDQLVITLADGNSLGLATKWLDAKPDEVEAAIRSHLDRANGYRTLGEAAADDAAVNADEAADEAAVNTDED